MSTQIYFDHNATTPVDPLVFEAMTPYFKEHFGNAASLNHIFGWTAKAAVEKARKDTADLIGSESREIYFTSGATESNNLVFEGLARAYPEKKHIIISEIEHESILDPARAFEENGYEITRIRVDRSGKVSPSDIKQALRSETLFVSIMMANNEVGTIQPIFTIGEICHEAGIFFHTDAVQATGKIEINVQSMNIDLLSLSGHKFYGPKGVGALFVRRRDPRVILDPLMYGGGQERALRPGTLNVPGIVGLGQACLLAKEAMESESERVRSLATKILEGLKKACPQITLNGHAVDRLGGNLSLTIPGIKNETLMCSLKNIAFSAGSACSTEKAGNSHVLKALGLSQKKINSTIRIGLGRFNTKEEVEYFIDRTVTEIRTHLRAQDVGLFQDPELKKTWRIQEDAYSHF